MPEENVKVAVRVRPFNRRERERNATVIVGMNGCTTSIQDPSQPNEDPKKFSFDHSYWSHDGCKEEGTGYFAPDPSQPNGRKFAGQQQVFDDLGEGVLKNAWEGYNSTLFAYGQTGSGKSWSVVGYGINKGIVPLFCEKMFNGINEKKGGDTEYEVTFSMLEIYNEQVRDLLSTTPGKKSGLRVRQSPKVGFYAEHLRVVPVAAYSDVEKRMEEGTTSRTVAATNMNATSSRAHTIVGITFDQVYKNDAGEETKKSSIINLVDLAGSERAESTGATGDRLKEGAAINQSLSCLGNVISALADKSSGKNTRVPYRDSVLTKLLKNALGGNSKTIMIAAISPADINYDESLSTLRYADRAKQIKTTASVNEDPTEKLIRELQEENERLKAAMASGNINMAMLKSGGDDDDDDMSDEEKAQIKAEYESLLEKNQREMEEMKKTFEEKMKEAGAATDGSEILEKKKTVPHLSNLNMDPQLCGHIIHFFEEPEVIIGKGSSAKIQLHGPSILDEHCVVRNENGVFTIEPHEANERMTRNGKTVTSKIELKHNDRLIFGTTQYFVFIYPKERDSANTPFPEVSFEMAQEEIAKRSGFDVDGGNKSRDDILLQNDLLDLMPGVEEANSISEELDKKMKFEVMIVSPEARGELDGRTEVMIKVTNLETKHEWVWPKEKFISRRYVMQEMYNEFLEGDEWDLPKEKDPFDEDYKSEYHIGSVKVWFQPLAYMVEAKEQLDIIDYQGKKVGVLNVDVLPCDNKGKAYTENDNIFVETPSELVGKDINVLININNARGLPSKFTAVYAKYKIQGQDEKFEQSQAVKGTSNPDWNFSKKFNFPKVQQKFVSFLEDGAMMIQIWGQQTEPKKKKSVNTKQAMINNAAQKGKMGAAKSIVDTSKVKYMMQVTVLQKRQERLENKLNAMKRMIEEAEKNNKKKLSTKLIKDIYNANTADEADKCIKMIPQEKDDDSDSSDSDDDKKNSTGRARSRKSSTSSRNSSSSPEKGKARSRKSSTSSRSTVPSPDKGPKRQPKNNYSPPASPKKKSSMCLLL